MERYCDLHTHSVYSDGTYTPAQIIAAAMDAGLSAVALCDHNTVEGLEQFHAAAQGMPIEAVGGIELSTEYLERDLHIVGLFIEPEHYDAIAAVMAEEHRRKAESNIRLIDVLRSKGYDLDYHEICGRNPGGNINRAHIAAAMMEKGYVASIQEAFSTLLSRKRGYYTPPKRIAARDGIHYLKSIGAVTILAHPFLDLTEEELEVFLPQAKDAGLDGMEVLYAKFDQAQRETAQVLAQKYGLLMSGGSDFHGENKPDIQIGRGYGDLFVPMTFLQQMKNKKICVF